MKKPLSETLYQSLVISGYIMTFILLVFGCLYIRDQHWFEKPEPVKQIRTVQVDTERQVLIRAEEIREAQDPLDMFTTLFGNSLEEGQVPIGQMIDTFLSSEFAHDVFTEEELKELQDLSTLTEEMLKDILGGQ